MKTGTKSLLFGVHQFLWHPYTVWRAWRELYGKPTWREFLCIVIHDWGYAGNANMDDAQGELHPVWAAAWALKWLGPEYATLCLGHSRHYARRMGSEPSRLCWADKLCIKYDPQWFYLLRARLSGEIDEYRINADRAALFPRYLTDASWFQWIHDRSLKMVKTNGAGVPMVNPAREAT